MFSFGRLHAQKILPRISFTEELGPVAPLQLLESILALPFLPNMSFRQLEEPGMRGTFYLVQL